MIETAKGVKNAEAIAATEGVDMVFIGTGDLSLSIGTFPTMHHDHSVACADVHRACKKAWTPCGIFTPSLEVAKMRRSQGYRMVVTANDMDVLARGFNQASSGFAAKPRWRRSSLRAGAAADRGLRLWPVPSASG